MCSGQCILIAVIFKRNYRLPTKLLEGNVFTGVCLSVRGGDGWVCLVPGPFWG